MQSTDSNLGGSAKAQQPAQQQPQQGGGSSGTLMSFVAIACLVVFAVFAMGGGAGGASAVVVEQGGDDAGGKSSGADSNSGGSKPAPPPPKAKAEPRCLPWQGEPYEPVNGVVRPKVPCAPMQHGREGMTPCPDEELYLSLWAMRRAKKHSWKLVDVGSNKGYSIAAMLNALQVPVFDKQHLGLDIYKYGEKHNTPHVGARHVLSGACCDPMSGDVWPHYRNLRFVRERNEQYAKHDAERDGPVMPLKTCVSDVEVWAIDGTRSHVEYNKHYFEATKRFIEEHYPEAPKLKFHYHFNAIAGREGTVQFPQDHLGAETAKMGSGENVAMTTLDKLLPEDLEFIDVLLTDAEGFDFDVADGATRWLKTGKALLYVLELHANRGVNQQTLGQFIKQLESAGYVCYFPLQGSIGRHVARVSHECWNDGMNRYRGWVNMACVNAKHAPELIEVFDELERMPKNAWWFPCRMQEVSTHFFSKFPNESWAWALEGTGIAPPAGGAASGCKGCTQHKAPPQRVENAGGPTSVAAP